MMAIAVVVVWGLTYILTKVLIQQGLHPHEIFFYRFLVAYAGIWLIAPRRLLANSWKEEGLLALAGFFGGSLYFYTEEYGFGTDAGFERGVSAVYGPVAYGLSLGGIL